MRPLEDEIQNTCTHFTGLLDPHCRAGIRYQDVRVGERVPCLRDEAGTSVCAAARFPTREEAADRVAHLRQATEDFVRKLDAGICPTCEGAIAEYQQVGRAVYGLPCWHRLYVGRVPRKKGA